MYRQYENPRELEKQRDQLRCVVIDENTTEDELIALHEELMELNDRINFAWQDEEYDMRED